jgi:hypothetical protein
MQSRPMTRKITPAKNSSLAGAHAAALAAARKAGGDENQSNWESRLEAEMTRRAKPVKKPAAR